MGEIAGSLVGKVVDISYGVAKKEMSYVCNYSRNVENLNNEVENLLGMKARVQQQIDLAKSRGELLLEGVQEWMKKADANISDATEFISKEAEAKKSCFNLRFCVNLSTLHYYSKISEEKTSFLRLHRGNGMYFETCVSLPAPTPLFTDLYERKNLENIDTQKSALKMIIEAIEDDTIQIVGINGLGGVGKTTLASEAAAKMKNQFADIVFIKVSQAVDVKMIQENVRVAASKILNGEMVLIILDDVWEELNLNEVGIPCGSRYMNCKILLTSRSRYVCEAMNADKNITANPLQDKEAWILFERVVGKTEWGSALKEIAFKIVKECGGLPLFIQAVGKALKNKETKSWEATLNRLQDPIDEDTPFKRKGIMELKLSYDYLESEVAKSCFLLCSMFPGTIGLKRLTYYGLGLGIFNNQDNNIKDAKYRAQLVVDSLKSSFLLLPEKEDEEEEFFKMHDLVREMAMLIISKGNDKFWMQSGRGLTEWQPKKHLESYKKISLVENRIRKLHDHKLIFPQLDTFLIQDNILTFVSSEFFRGMEKLKVLDMSSNSILSLPQSLKHLTELRTLDLSGNIFLCEISVLGELSCLEILKLRRTGIVNIPKEIGHLTNLRLLDVYLCEELCDVTCGVISKLNKLEELYVGLEESNCNFLQEISESLKILHLKVPQLHNIPEDFHFENLIEFLIEDNFFRYPTDDCKRVLHISKNSFPMMKLIQMSERINLWVIEELDNLLPDLYLECCDKLKYIELAKCDNIISLVDTWKLPTMRTCFTSAELVQKKVFSQVEKIELYYLESLVILWDRPHQYISFCNLMTIIIKDCPFLLELFPLSVAKGLVNLRDIRIVKCVGLEVVISWEDTESVDTNIVFPVTNIHLYDLPKLESFYSGHAIINYLSLENMSVESCPTMKRWSYGENHMPKLRFEHESRPYRNINEYISEVQHKTDGKLIMWKKRSRDDTAGNINGTWTLVDHLRHRVRSDVSFDEGATMKAALLFRVPGDRLYSLPVLLCCAFILASLVAL